MMDQSTNVQPQMKSDQHMLLQQLLSSVSSQVYEVLDLLKSLKKADYLVTAQKSRMNAKRKTLLAISSELSETKGNISFFNPLDKDETVIVSFSTVG